MRHLLLFLLAVPAVALAGGEQAIQPGALPAAVQSAVAQAYPGATIVGASTEFKDGAKRYEVQVKSPDGRTDLAYSADGKLLETEVQLAESALPKPVQTALSTKYAGWDVKKAEKSTRGSKTVYEMVVAKGKKAMEVVFDEKGAQMKTGDEDEAKPDHEGDKARSDEDGEHEGHEGDESDEDGD